MDRRHWIDANSSTWSPDSGVANSPASSSSLTPHSDIHGQQYPPYNQNIYCAPAMTHETDRPYLEIVEQPCSMFRFRYQSEMHGTHGSLMGQSSERSQKRYPTVMLRAFNGVEAFVRCTLTQVDRPGRRGPQKPHSHKLVIKKGQTEECDPHIVTVKRENGFQAIFQGMGIIHTAKKDIPGELYPKMIRMKEYEKQIHLNQFETDQLAREAAEEAKNMNLNQVCLCFQAFAYENNVWHELCDPVYSQTINNIKSALTGELKICRVNTTVSPANGGQEVYLLVEKVNKGDIHVEFYENGPDCSKSWQKNAKVLDVHHQYAIVIETPPYHNQQIKEPVKVFMELYRGKDGCRSKPWEFRYIPIDSCHPGKRARVEETQYSVPTFLNSVSSNFDIHNEDFLKILRDLQSVEASDLPDLQDPELQLDAEAGPNSQQATETNDNKLQSSSGFMFFKLAILLSHKHGTTPNTRQNLLKLFMLSNRNRQNFLFSAIENDIPLLFKSSIDMIKQYQIGEEVLSLRNERNETCLHLAALYDRVNMIKALINAGADPNRVDAEGNTIAHVCVAYDRVDCLKALIVSCAERPGFLNLEIQNFIGLTPLHLAVRSSKLDVIKCLVESGASPYARDAKTGDTILHTAVEHSALESTKYILKTFTDINLANTTNQADYTPLQVLIGNYTDEDGDEEDIPEIDLVIGKYLIENGADSRGISQFILEKIKCVKEIPDDIRKNESELMPPPGGPLTTVDQKISERDTASSNKSVINQSGQNSTSIPLKFDKIALDELTNILKVDDLWRKIAELLEMDAFTSVWESTSTPVKCLLDYIQAKNVNPEHLCNVFQALGIDKACGVIDSLLTRQLSF